MVGFGVVGTGVGFCVGLFVGRPVGFEVRYDWSLRLPWLHLEREPWQV